LQCSCCEASGDFCIFVQLLTREREFHSHPHIHTYINISLVFLLLFSSKHFFESNCSFPAVSTACLFLRVLRRCSSLIDWKHLKECGRDGVCHWCPIFTKIGMFWQILVKLHNIKCLENPSSRSRLLHADGRTEKAKMVCAILQHLVADAPKNYCLCQKPNPGRPAYT
jgi:hypothetical protein